MLQTGTAALFSLAALLVAGASEAGEITAMSTVAVREPYLELVPAFERATENKVETMWVGVSAQNERIKGGEIVDLVIGTASGIDELNKLGRLVSGVAMAKSGIGAAVLSGAPRPDISSGEALKRTLLASKSIALSAAGPSGVYLSGLFQKWGIADELKPKIKQSPGRFGARWRRDRLPAGERAYRRKGHHLSGSPAGRHTADHCLFGRRAQPS
jgi:molybdate transport system substrate-binding protein